MTDDLVRRLRCYADIDDAVYNPWVYGEAADRIEKLEMAARGVPLRDMAALSKALDRIEKLTAALQKIKDLHHGPEDEDVLWIRDDMTYQIVYDTLEAIDPSPQPPSRD